MWENIAGAKIYSRPRGFNIAGASAPVAPAVPTALGRRGMWPRRMRQMLSDARQPASQPPALPYRTAPETPVIAGSGERSGF